MGACLRTGAAAARAISTHLEVPLIGVNHCVAHIEIGREQCGCDDPILLYVSGGNTQVIARLDGRYRVLGETLDIGIGNMLDKFARNHGIPFPGGPVIEKKALEWLEKNPNPSLEGLELPYAVQNGWHSGIMSAANRLVNEGKPFEAVCWVYRNMHSPHVSRLLKEHLHILERPRFCLAEVLLATKECEICRQLCAKSAVLVVIAHHVCIASITGL